MEQLIKSSETDHKALVDLPKKLAKHPAGSAARFDALLTGNTKALLRQLGARKFCEAVFTSSRVTYTDRYVLKGILYTSSRFGHSEEKINKVLDELLGVAVGVKWDQACLCYRLTIPLPDDFDEVAVQRDIRKAEQAKKKAVTRLAMLKRKKRTVEDAKKKIK